MSRAVPHPLHWARRWTKTKDEQDTENAHKHLPTINTSENGGEALDVAISSKVPKVKVISSAARRAHHCCRVQPGGPDAR
jgi:hypothetical protein